MPAKQEIPNQKARQRTLSDYLKVDSVKGNNQQLVTSFLFGSLWLALLVPALFYLQFGIIDWFAIAFTIFMMVLCLLFALGLWLQSRTYHTTVTLKNNWGDKVGAFWLVACAFGPFFGWLATSMSPSFTSWRWQYYARVFMAVVLPVITAVPLLRYARGKAALVALPLLIIITSLPILSCLWVISDLHDGPKTGQFTIERDRSTGRLDCIALDRQSSSVPCDAQFSRIGKQVEVVWLPHTNRVIKVSPVAKQSP